MQPIFYRETDRFGRPITSGWMPALRQFDQLFNELLGPTASTESLTDYSPAYDVQENDDHYALTFDVPGVDRNDLNIELLGSKLVVSGERKAAEGTAGTRQRRHGKFQHVFTLPEGVTTESIEANYKDGVLTLAVQKPAAVRPSKIRIGDGANKSGGFIKNLIGDKKGSKETVEIKHEKTAMAN